MNKTKISLGVAIAGFAVQLFTYFCGNQLNAQTLANFNLDSGVALFVAFIMFALNVSCAVETLRKDVDDRNDDCRQDFDAVYRYIDDINRDLTQSVDDACRRSKK